MRKPDVLDALFSKARKNVLSAVFLAPEKWWYHSELAKHVGATPSSLQREVKALSEAGILESAADGRRVYYRPDASCAVYEELLGIFTKTAGIVPSLRRVIAPLREAVEVAFIYGSVARGDETAASDVDLLLIGGVSLRDVTATVRPAEASLRRQINPSVYSAREFASRHVGGNHFIRSVTAAPKIFLIGGQNDLDRLVEREAGGSTRDESGGVGRPAVRGTA